MFEGNHRDKGKQKVQKFEIGMSSKPINMETQERRIYLNPKKL